MLIDKSKAFIVEKILIYIFLEDLYHSLDCEEESVQVFSTTRKGI